MCVYRIYINICVRTHTHAKVGSLAQRFLWRSGGAAGGRMDSGRLGAGRGAPAGDLANPRSAVSARLSLLPLRGFSGSRRAWQGRLRVFL